MNYGQKERNESQEGIIRIPQPIQNDDDDMDNNDDDKKMEPLDDKKMTTSEWQGANVNEKQEWPNWKTRVAGGGNTSNNNETDETIAVAAALLPVQHKHEISAPSSLRQRRKQIIDQERLRLAHDSDVKLKAIPISAKAKTIHEPDSNTQKDGVKVHPDQKSSCAHPKQMPGADFLSRS